MEANMNEAKERKYWQAIDALLCANELCSYDDRGRPCCDPPEKIASAFDLGIDDAKEIYELYTTYVNRTDHER